MGTNSYTLESFADIADEFCDDIDYTSNEGLLIEEKVSYDVEESNHEILSNCLSVG